MGKSKTTGKGRLDKFYYLAKEQGYRSRAAFKLVQLNRKYQFLEKSRSVLDLCAAPGGWLQVAAKYMPVASLIVGVDLVPIRPIRGCITLTEDITTAKCRSEIKKILKGNLLDVVLHDGSPNVGGAWAKEALNQAALSLDALKLATEFLRPGGIFVSKVFRSQDYNALLFAFKQLFNKVEATKPMASRATSAEIYVIGMGYKAPAKIDPRLLDSRHVFKEIAEPAKIVDVLSESKRKRHRGGYEDGVSVLYKTSTAAEFVASDKPVEFLGTFHAITFTSPACAPLRAHPATDAEVLVSCEDLRVLGKREFKHLLKWRMLIRNSQKKAEAGDDDAAADRDDAAMSQKAKEDEEGIATAEDAEEKSEAVVMEEMQELRDLLDSKKKRAKKALSKRRDKSKARAATGTNVDVLTDVYGEDDLFSLKAIKNTKQLKSVDDAAVPNDDDLAGGSSTEEEGEPALSDTEDEDNSDIEADLTRQRYDRQMDAYFEEAYEKYRAATDGSTKRRTRARLQDKGEDQGELWEANEDAAGGDEGEDGAHPANDDGEEGEEGEEAEDDNPLLVSLAEKLDPAAQQKRLAAAWFSQDIFEGFDSAAPAGGAAAGKAASKAADGAGARRGKGVKEQGFDDEDADVAMGDGEVAEEKEEGAKGGQKKPSLKKRVEQNGTAVAMKTNKKGKEEAAATPLPGGGDGASNGVAPADKAGRGVAGAAAAAAQKRASAKLAEENGFEVVPEERERRGGGRGSGSEEEDSDDAASSSSDDDGEDYDSDEKAQTLAYAHRMMRKKQREEILDEAYNRYTFDDAGLLPRWFAEDERRHMQMQRPITKEEVDAIKAQNRAINARPTKKVAEAKARKRRVAMKKMEAVRQKATAIADQDDLNNNAKSKMMDRLYAKALRKKDTKRPVIVAKKGGQGNRGKGAKGLMVDRRMLADTRSQRAKGKKGSKGAKGGRGKSGGGKGGGKGKSSGGAGGGRSPGGSGGKKR